jgi:F0F1-type ATP synthase membrane subunit b/b'
MKVIRALKVLRDTIVKAFRCIKRILSYTGKYMLYILLSLVGVLIFLAYLVLPRRNYIDKRIEEIDREIDARKKRQEELEKELEELKKGGEEIEKRDKITNIDDALAKLNDVLKRIQSDKGGKR